MWLHLLEEGHYKCCLSYLAQLGTGQEQGTMSPHAYHRVIGSHSSQRALHKTELTYTSGVSLALYGLCRVTAAVKPIETKPLYRLVTSNK